MISGRTAIVAAALHFCFIPLLPAQVLPSVDIDTAKTQIDQFLNENELIDERISELQKTNEESPVDVSSNDEDIEVPI